MLTEHQRGWLSKETSILTNLQAMNTRARVAAIVVSGESPLCLVGRYLISVHTYGGPDGSSPMLSQILLYGSVSQSQKGLPHMDFGNIQS